MKSLPIRMSLFVLLASMLCLSQVFAALTTEQRKEIAEIKRELSQVQRMISKDEFDAALKILDESESKLRKIAKDALIPETDRTLLSSFKLISIKRELIEKKTGTVTGLSFSEEVAPILAAKCANCHNETRSSGGLSLENFAGMKKGGSNGALLNVGSATSSLIIARISGGNNRMPRGGNPLSADEIRKIGTWINQGAKFDGDDEDAKFGDKPAKPGVAVTIAKATGDETVSFTKDIAPFMGNLCVRCHSGNNPRGGLSLENFEKLMAGGDSGRVILPGNLEGSRLWRLVGGLEAPRMPQGQARITRKNYEDLKTWLTEGAKYDGDDPKTPLRSLIPSEEDIKAAELAKMSPDEFAKFRLDRSEEQWKRANPRETHRYLESKEFFVFGNLNETRLKEISDASEEFAKSLRTAFNIRGEPIFKGKLTVFVFKDRFSFEEFPRVVQGAEVPRETIGLSQVTTAFEDAYICLEDVGDDASADSPGFQITLKEHLTGAFLKSSGKNMPDWVVRGTGLALAARDDRKNPFLDGMNAAAMDSLKGIGSPAEIFANGTFSSADLGPVGFTLVEHMLTAGGPAKFGQFVSQLQSDNNVRAALRAVYNVDENALATSYLKDLSTKKR